MNNPESDYVSPVTKILTVFQEKDKYEEMLSNLGESVATNPDYDRETTHLIVDEPLRSEKMLCSLAAGIWVLHTSFINHMSIHQKYVAVSVCVFWKLMGFLSFFNPIFFNP